MPDAEINTGRFQIMTKGVHYYYFFFDGIKIITEVLILGDIGGMKNFQPICGKRSKIKRSQ